MKNMFDLYNPRFLLCYLPEPDDNKRIKSFFITNDQYRIINLLSDRSPGYEYEIFSNYNEAIEYLYEIMDFEDQFLFGIIKKENLRLNYLYVKEED